MLPQLSQSDVLPNIDIAQIPHARVTADMREVVLHALNILMIGRYATPHQPVWSGQAVEPEE